MWYLCLSIAEFLSPFLIGRGRQVTVNRGGLIINVSLASSPMSVTRPAPPGRQPIVCPPCTRGRFAQPPLSATRR